MLKLNYLDGVKMLGKSITVDFEKKCGRIKPLCSVNGGPRSGGAGLVYDFADEFCRMGVPFVRVGAASGDYGYNQFLNIHSIFPDFSADETLEESYNFLPTDLYLASVKAVGAEIFYCFGEASEPYSKKLFVSPPIDKEKWARICEHILMHYNEGWANGFKWNIKYVEIWNSPDTPEGFSASAEEYFELYRITANYLRERFPKLKIGAYGAGGFYSLNRIDATEEMKGYVPFMQQFLSYINREETQAPIDFFSWSCVTQNPEELAMHAKYARSYLDGAGHKRVRSIISRYNTVSGQTPPCLSQSFPSELASSLILIQKSSADMMFYSSADASSPENGLFSVEDHTAHRHYSAYNVMCFFAELYRLGTAVETTADYSKEIYSLGAKGDDGGAIMLVTRKYSGKAEIVLRGSTYTACSVTKVQPTSDRGAPNIFKAENVAIAGSKIVLPVKENEIYLIRLF